MGSLLDTVVRLVTGLISSFFWSAFCGLCGEASVCLKRTIWLLWSSRGSSDGSQIRILCGKRPLSGLKSHWCLLSLASPKRRALGWNSLWLLLCLGDVRKALQMLNSAPIAAKTPATLANLRKLHPSPSLYRRCCSQSFVLFRCVRAESFVFTRALTSAVNEFACGRAPAFLKRYVGGVSIALEKTKTSVCRWLVVTLFGA